MNTPSKRLTLVDGGATTRESIEKVLRGGLEMMSYQDISTDLELGTLGL